MKPTALLLAVASAYSEERIEDSAIKSLGIAERKVLAKNQKTA